MFSTFFRRDALVSCRKMDVEEDEVMRAKRTRASCKITYDETWKFDWADDDDFLENEAETSLAPENQTTKTKEEKETEESPLRKPLHAFEIPRPDAFRHKQKDAIEHNLALRATAFEILRFKINIEDVLIIALFACLNSDFVTTRDVICLLYTSPSPRDATLSRMPSSA